MALINCPECSKKISDKATACPSCGCPVKKTLLNDNMIKFNKKIDKIGNTKTGAKLNKLYIIISMVVISVIVVFFINSNNNNLNYISDKAYDAGITSLQIIDEWLDRKTSLETARKSIDSINNSIKDIKSNEEYKYDYFVKFNISSLSSDLFFYSYDDDGSYTKNDILDTRNELAKWINAKQRNSIYD